ncbi:MAG: cytochrome c maturation protein CcmE [Bacteroidales bacterium]|nr:cytochrome c maturation protein CcmE [Bacteroidales bacterium]
MKKTHIVLIILLVVALAIIISTLSDVSSYAGFKEASKTPGKQFNIIGKLNLEKPIEQKIVDGGQQLSFFMFDNKNEESQVFFYGDKPQDFEKSEQVVLMGSMEGTVFVATNILLKCPSKYDQEGLNTTEEFSTE